MRTENPDIAVPYFKSEIVLLKSGILEANLLEPIVQPLYAASARHYGCAVLFP
jgi:hypothetical protein